MRNAAGASREWATDRSNTEYGLAASPTYTQAWAVRPLAIGRKNWLHLGGDGGLRPTAVLLSVAASVKRHGVNPWVYIQHVLTELPARQPGADLTDLLPDGWTRARVGALMGAG